MFIMYSDATDDMPASSTENCSYIEETLRSSIAGKKSIDNQLLSSSKRILLNKIEFKAAEKPYSLQIDSLRSKYIPLNPSKDYNQSNSAESNDTSNKVSKMVNNSDSLDGFPVPSVVLYPEEKVILEWKRFQKVGAGLINMGNTCFLNSILQCLTYTAPLANYCMTEEHNIACKQAGFCMMCEVQRHIKRSCENAGGAIKPQAILQKLKMIAKHMQWGRQEDAHEFLRYVVDAMQRSCLNGHTKLDKFSKETTVVNQIFGGFLRSQVQCMKCKEKSNTYDPFMDISLDIKSSQTVEKAFEKYVLPETLDNDNAYMCTNCKQKVPAHKRFSIHRAPNVLTLSLKRFDYHRYNGKITRHVNFSETLNLRPYMSTKQGEPIYYNLYAVLVHSGYHCNAGHYFCYVKSPSQTWYCMNDSMVQQVSANRVFGTEAYLLFYIKSPSLNRKKMSAGVGANITNNHIINNKKFKGLNGMTGHPGKDIGFPVIRNTKTSLLHNDTKSATSGTPLPDKRDKVAFGIKQQSAVKTQETPSEDKPRIVMQIKNGIVTTYEKSPNGKQKIVNGPDNRAGLVPYGEDSDSDTEPKVKTEKRKRSPPKVDKDESMPSSPKKFKENKKLFENSVIFDKKLNATTSVPGNTNLLETAFAKEKRFNNDIKTNKKLDGLNLMISKPKDSVFKFDRDTTSLKGLEHSSISGTLHLGKNMNSTTNWHVLNQDAVPSPSVGSNSSKDSVNSTTEWHATDKKEVPKIPKVSDRQFLGWKVINENHRNGDINAGSKDNQNGKLDFSDKPKTKDGASHSNNTKSVADAAEIRKCDIPVTSYSDTQLLKMKNDSGDSYVSSSDKQSLLSGEDSEYRSKRKKHKKHKKHKRNHSDIRYKELVNESDVSSDSKVKKHKKKKKHKRDRKDDDEEEEREEHHHKKRKLDQEEESDNSGEFMWVEKTKDSLSDTNLNQNAVPAQTWDHHVKDGYKRQKNGVSDTKINSWDGNKSSRVAEELENKYSLNGYGQSVNSWDGGQNTIDKDSEKDKQRDKKRHWSDDYDEEFDKGKVKRVKKSHSEHNYYSSHNPFQLVQDDKNKWKSKEPVKSQSYHSSSHHHHSNSSSHHQSKHYHRDHNGHGYHSSSTHSYRH